LKATTSVQQTTSSGSEFQAAVTRLIKKICTCINTTMLTDWLVRMATCNRIMNGNKRIRQWNVNQIMYNLFKVVHSDVLYISEWRRGPRNVAGPGVAYPYPPSQQACSWGSHMCNKLRDNKTTIKQLEMVAVESVFCRTERGDRNLQTTCIL